jgi:DNA-binding MarR family transcriptional regulator
VAASKKIGKPLLGALLRKVRHRIVSRVIDALTRSGFPEIREPHMAVFQHPPPRGVSPIALAERARMSKQAINQLLGTLERAGYLERRDDRTRAGGRQIWLTARGERAVAVMRRTIRAVERELEREVGTQRFAVMVGCLRELAAGES